MTGGSMQQYCWSARTTRMSFLCVAIAALWVLPGLAFEAREPLDEATAKRGFIENRGQIDSAVRFYAAGNRSAVYFTAEGPVLEVRGTYATDGNKAEPISALPSRSREQRTRSQVSRVAMAIQFVVHNLRSSGGRQK